MRAEHTINIPLGFVVEDEAGETWTFIGWQRNRAGNQAFFAHVPVRGPAYIYHASMAQTLARKFPALAARVPPIDRLRNQLESCPRCNGEGWLHPIDPMRCDGNYITSRPCPACNHGSYQP